MLIPRREIMLENIAVSSGEKWERLTEQASQLIKGNGSESRRFEERRARLEAIVQEDAQRLSLALQQKIDIRACTDLWLESEKFLSNCPVSSQALKRFRQINQKQSFLVLLNLISLYFQKFDHCGDLASLAKFLSAELQLHRDEVLSPQLRKIKLHQKKLLSAKGYKLVSNTADALNLDVEGAMHDLGVNMVKQGRFIELAVGYHFIERLSRLAPDDDPAILAEMQKPSISEIRYEDRLLGQHAIETLVNNALKRGIDIPERWIETILTIAGDPRVSRTSDHFRKWWAGIAPAVIAKVSEQLGAFDLKLFLEALDDFSRRSGNEALKRMFPKRRLLLEGLRKQNLIKGARLFVGREADAFLKRNFKPEQLPSYARLEDRETSVIYLRLPKAHIVEGSHNHRFWIYDEIPPESPPLNYNRNRFARSELSNFSREKKIMRTRSRGEFPWYVSHNGSWQARVIGQLRKMGIRLDPELMLDREDYRHFRRTEGV